MNKDRTYIIAEAGVNHNGSLDMAIELVKRAAEAGADAVKFQTFNSSQLVRRNASKAEYQKKTTNANESQLEMLQKLELSMDQHYQLMSVCRQLKIEFISSPFDLHSLEFIVHDLCLNTIKIGSGEITNFPLLFQAARSGVNIILSTGMSGLGEIESALNLIAYGYAYLQQPPTKEEIIRFVTQYGRENINGKLQLLHCTSEYPAPYNEINLRAMNTLEQAFQLPVGYSDHSEGTMVPIAAVAMGARIIEKHFTLDRNLDGPDHKASIEPEELAQMVTAIRNVESALGTGLKMITPSEYNNRTIVRKSLVAAAPIRKGERFSISNLTTKRPGTGISANKFWEWVGKIAEQDYEEDEMIDS